VRKKIRSIPEVEATVKKAKMGREVALKKTRNLGYREAGGLGSPAVRMAIWPLMEKAVRH
jgi:hypothetical protein